MNLIKMFYFVKDLMRLQKLRKNMKKSDEIMERVNHEFANMRFEDWKRFSDPKFPDDSCIISIRLMKGARV